MGGVERKGREGYVGKEGTDDDDFEEFEEVRRRVMSQESRNSIPHVKLRDKTRVNWS